MVWYNILKNTASIQQTKQQISFKETKSVDFRN